MKKFILITTVSAILFSCGNGSDKAENIKMEHLYAYLYNNGVSELQIYPWSDSTAVFSNDAHIFNKLNADGFFMGAEDYESSLLSLFDSLHYSFDKISDYNVSEAIKKITKTSNYHYGYFLIDKTNTEKFDGNNYFSVLPVTRKTTVPKLRVDTFYYSSKVNNLINEFNQKISDGTLTPSDTLIEDDSMEGEVEIGEDGEIMPYLTVVGNKGFTKKEKVKVMGSDGYEYTEETDMYYSGIAKTKSVLAGYYNNGVDGIYIIDDIKHLKEKETVNYFNNNRESVIKPRVRKFDKNGLQQWSYCTLPCEADSNQSLFNDLSYYSLCVYDGKVYLCMLEENLSFNFSYGGVGRINPLDYSIVLALINEKNGELISMNRISNEDYLSIYTSIKKNNGVISFVNKDNSPFKNDDKSFGEKFENINNPVGNINNNTKSNFKVEIRTGKNIKGSSFEYFRYQDEKGNKGFHFFKKPYEYGCDCELETE